MSNDTVVLVLSTKRKLNMLHSHCECLGPTSAEAASGDDWKDEVESRVRNCIETSVDFEGCILDGETEPNEISQ